MAEEKTLFYIQIYRRNAEETVAQEKMLFYIPTPTGFPWNISDDIRWRVKQQIRN